MRIEKEIKLQQQPIISNEISSKKLVSVNDVCNILNQFHIQINKLDKAIHNDTYFDTDNFLLYSTDASLRIRHDETRIILKKKTEPHFQALCRKEWQNYLVKGQNTLDAVNEMFHKHIGMELVYPQLGIHLIRESIYVTTDSGKYQICLDEYVCQVINKEISQSHFEIEIETIISTSQNDIILEQFICNIIEKFNLKYIHQSKYHIAISAYMKRRTFHE